MQGRLGKCGSAMHEVLTCSYLQVKQLCLGIPYDLKSPDGNELDEFMSRKEHPLARILRDLSSKESVRPSPGGLEFQHKTLSLFLASAGSVATRPAWRPVPGQARLQCRAAGMGLGPLAHSTPALLAPPVMPCTAQKVVMSQSLPLARFVVSHARKLATSCAASG